MKESIRWAQRNERKLGAIAFTFGFVTDLLAFTLLSADVVNLAFLGYVALALGSMIGSYAFAPYRGEGNPIAKRSLAVGLPFATQYAIGGVLSGSIIFYAKSSVLAVSWPFLFLLAGVYFGNEYFRRYKEHLMFQTVLVFFTLYAYTIFALPLFVNRLGPWVFLGSTAIALAVFALALRLLYRIDPVRLRASLRRIVLSIAVIVIAVNAAYFTGTIPPLPLAVKEIGIYHGIEKTAGGYTLLAEDPKPWWNILPPVVRLAPGETAHAYSAVFAPGKFSGSIAHHWEYHDGNRWVSAGRIPFAISGGREQGYRGYSEKASVAPGRWRVSVEIGGQTIGRTEFRIERVAAKPALHEEYR